MIMSNVIAALAHLDHSLAKELEDLDGVISVTISPKAFKTLVDALAKSHRKTVVKRGLNRVDIGDIVVRCAVPYRDGAQPEIKREAS